ncbi:MAG: hypothetical protein ACQEXX_18395 [Bacillota bacterium]
MPYTKPVTIEPYYGTPVWIDHEVPIKEYIPLSAQCNNEEVELFLSHLFGYNDIDVNRSLEEAFNDLFEQESLVLSGGVAFFEDEQKVIMPSCCCGLEEIEEIYESIRNKMSPWLGHDPDPGVVYEDDYARVLSNDPESTDPEKLYYIEYKYEELLECLEKTRNDLLEFIEKPLFNWIYLRNQEIGYEMILKMKECFMNDMI